jgi:glycosyltransferase involved in cell wall biosynthesis
MRVLWFTNTPSLGAEFLNSKEIGGGWIESLEAELAKVPYIKLAISFKLGNSDIKQFSVGNTSYYPIYIKPRKNRFTEKILRWSHNVENENNIQPYLDIIRKFKPDLIHIFGSESAFGLIISKTTVPCMIYLQGNLTVINLKWFSGLTAVDILKYSNKWTLLKGYGLYHNYFLNKKAAEREISIFKSCKYFIGRTDWDRRISSILSPGSKYFHSDEIMRPSFYLQQWRPKSNQTDFVLISTVRNNIFKGLETIYECKKILNQNFSEYNIGWKIAGITEEDEIANLIERKFRDKFNDVKIHLLGHLQENELLDELLNADLFVHPSHIDNSPNSVCEAMLIGMPVIATFAGGIPSIIDNKEEGLLVQDGDHYALAGAIIELIKDRNYAVSLGTKARKKAFIRHNPDRILKDILNIYNSVVTNQ